MKKSFFLRVLSMIASFFSNHLNLFADACERQFTLGIIQRSGAITSPGYAADERDEADGRIVRTALNTIAQNDPIVNMQGEINMLPNVPAMTQVIVSNAGGGAVAKTVYFLNEDIFNATPGNNGSGEASISNTYGDGWSGNGYNQLAKALSAQNGIKCYGLTLSFVTTSTGNENSSGLATAQPTWLMASMVGSSQIPKGFVLNAGKRNTQYLSGTMTISGVFFMNSLCQLSYVVPAGNTVTLTVLTSPLS
ncbi:MAG TPA: hypothetical protein VEB40_01020 [Flavipsychrobacter sp.]|nr:hypothetical protein [Flavipsychrobacter sp.]